MSTPSNDLKKILRIPDKEKLAFEKEILQFAIMQNIKDHLGNKKYSSIADEMGVSKSFISQLFSGDKKINIDLMVKFQRALKFKFKIDSFSTEESNQEAKVVNMYHYQGPVDISTANPQSFEVTNSADAH
jgi:transcriptional regulator with XRE-family HTH domain